MKYSIRVKFLGWLLFFMVLSSILSFLADRLHHVLEAEGVIPEAFGLTGELTVFIVVHIALFPVVALIGWHVARRMLAPVRSISETARSIVDGQLTARIEADVPDDELGTLSQVINQAFDRYEASLKQLERFNADASHQLRTPLTALRMKGEVCLNRTRSGEEYRETIQAMLEQLARLSRIVEQLLDLSRLGAASMRKQFESVDILQVARRAALDFEPLCAEKEVSLVVPRNDRSLRIRGDEALIEQVFANLLDNAIRFTPPNGSIGVDVEATASGHDVCVSISDTGPGIPESSASSVFERFNKGSRPESNGAGLGLAIVAEIVRVHSGRIGLERNPGGGTTVTVTLPAA
jgi:two-component system, OmpR family, sensor histidine kinase TctE